MSKDSAESHQTVFLRDGGDSRCQGMRLGILGCSSQLKGLYFVLFALVQREKSKPISSTSQLHNLQLATSQLKLAALLV